VFPLPQAPKSNRVAIKEAEAIINLFRFMSLFLSFLGDYFLLIVTKITKSDNHVSN